MQSTTSKQRNSGARSSKLNPDDYEWLSVQRAHFTFSPRPSDWVTWTGEGRQGSAARAQAAGGVGAAGTLGRSGGRS